MRRRTGSAGRSGPEGRSGSAGRSGPEGRSGPAARLAILALAVVAVGCSDGYGTSGPDYAPPANHTVLRGGAYHAPGLSDPLANCADCHGANLMGGADGEPSCFQCHGKRWNDRAPAAEAPSPIGEGRGLGAR